VGWITQDDYDKKARELKERQAEIAAQIEQHQHGDGEYRTTLESLISLASRAAELFERSKIEQKRQLIAFVFSVLARLGGGFRGDRNTAVMAGAATRLLKAFATQVEALRRLRNGGSQFVRVEHVHVNDGGQAVIGNVKGPAE